MYTLFKPFGSIAWEKENLSELVTVVGVSASPAPASELEAGLGVCDILIGDVDISVDRKLLAKAPKLKAVLCTSVGVDYVDAEALNERGIVLANDPDFCSNAVGEFAMGLIYALLRKIPSGTEMLKSNRWGERGALGGVELFGKTLGLLAFGRIGREVARQALGVGMKVVAYSPHLNRKVAEDRGVVPVSFEELLRTSDVVSLHMPLSDETKHIIGAPELASMKDGAYLINVARGGVLDEKALLAALESGKLAGAALDVLEQEPPAPEHPLLRAAQKHNLILTPHIGWHSFDARDKSLNCLKRQVAAVVAGRLPDECLNAAHAALPR
ncbi:MAG: phosphoglycerate dehydrogenase [Clostridiales Family XIII bacterium]|jgi:phosphoglycerate dehydrogenase-like enzyme|nr:phosphoglycerate dehydrogenase [Clostridiales Family XIII bacterium]